MRRIANQAPKIRHTVTSYSPRMDHSLVIMALLSVLWPCVNAKELLITPGPPEEFCEDCVPFSACIESPSHCFTSHTTVFLLAEDYNLTAPIAVEDVQNLTICGGGNTCSCKGQCSEVDHGACGQYRDDWISDNCSHNGSGSIHKYCSHNTTGDRRSALICIGEAGLSFTNVSFLHLININFNWCGFEIDTSHLFFEAHHRQRFLKNTLKAGLQLMVTFHTVIECVHISNSTGNGIFWINPYDSCLKNSIVAHTNYHIMQQQLSGSIDCFNNTHCQGGNVWILFVDTQCHLESTYTTFFIQNTDISYGVNLNNWIGGARYAAGIGVTLSQTAFDVAVRIQGSNIHDNVADAGANAYFRIMYFVSNSTIEVSNTSLSYGNRPFTDPQFMQYYDQATGIDIDIDSMTVVKFGHGAPLKLCRKHLPDTIDTSIVFSEVSMINNRGGGMKIYIADVGRGQSCCFNISVSNTVIEGTQVYYYDPDVRSSIALFIQEERTETKHILNVSFSNVQISNSSIVFNDISSELDDYPKISTVLLSDVTSAYFSNSIIEHSKATGLVALSSKFYFVDQNILRNNSGTMGGALSLDSSVVYLHPDSVLNIVGNSASVGGGGIAINDGLIAGHPKACFYQLVPRDNHSNILTTGARVIMEDNHAGVTGHSLYGEMYGECTQMYQNLLYRTQRKTPVEVFNATFQIKGDTRDSEISSVALGLRFCAEDNRYAYDTAVKMRNLTIYPGESVTIEAIGLGYAGTAPAIIKHKVENLNASEQTVPNARPIGGPHQLGTKCRNLTFRLEAPENVTDIGVRLVAEGSVRPYSYSVLLNVSTQVCPPGFQLVENKCRCQPVLHRLFVGCNIDNQSFSHLGSVWLSFSDHTVLYHEHCLPGYCSTGPVSFRTTNPDAQCANDHSGTLCGGCKEGFSIALGSSKCLKCTNTYLLLIPVFLVAGILLTMFLTVINFTVATGTINTLIFYASIVQANQESFGVTAYGNRMAVVFIAWLNLDFGFEVCLCNGLDMYSKTFLQFAFPVYVWVLIASIIVSSHYSTVMARLSGRNAVPVLATLFLLSHAKILRAIITAFSFTLIHKDDATSFLAWLYDGNVQFLHGKHLVLLIVCVLFAFLFVIPLILLTLLAPCLQRIHYYQIERLMARLKPLLDAYQGPYKDQFRFWTGLMLVVQTLLLIGSAMNVSGDPGITLLVIVLVSTLVLLLSLLRFSGVYRNTLQTCLQSFYLYNLVFFASWSLFNRYHFQGTKLIRWQQVTIHTTTGMTALAFAVTVCYHSVDRLRRCARKLYRSVWQRNATSTVRHGAFVTTPEAELMPLHAPTFSVVSVRELAHIENSM